MINDKCVFAGSFDPVTKGHIDVIGKCAMMFKTVYVVLAVNAEKKYAFNKETRLKMLELSLEKYEGVKVFAYDGLIVDFMKEHGVFYYARGIRGERDIEYEDRAFEFNSKTYPDLKTVYIPCGKEFRSVSSTLVREKLKKGEDVKKYLPYEILPLIKDVIM